MDLTKRVDFSFPHDTSGKGKRDQEILNQPVINTCMIGETYVYICCEARKIVDIGVQHGIFFCPCKSNIIKIRFKLKLQKTFWATNLSFFNTCLILVMLFLNKLNATKFTKKLTWRETNTFYYTERSIS